MKERNFEDFPKRFDEEFQSDYVLIGDDWLNLESLQDIQMIQGIDIIREFEILCEEGYITENSLKVIKEYLGV